MPDYQRGYAWGEHQVRALLEDIENLEKRDHVHYTGTLVLSSREKTGEDKVFDIVDGQQRLTTLSILLSVLIKRVDNVKIKTEMLAIYQWRGEEGNQQRVFCLNRHIDQYFRECVIDHKAKSECKSIEFISEKLISKSYDLIRKWVDGLLANGENSEALIERISNLIGFIVYQPNDKKEAGMMFEVINNRGKPLTELEKVKNYLIYYSIKKDKENLRETVDLFWGEILKNLASAHKLMNPDEKIFLRSAVITYLGFGKEESQNIYETLKKKFPIKGSSDDDWKKLRDFVRFLRGCSSYYEALMNDASSYRRNDLADLPDIIEQIELIRSQSSHAAILPIYFALMDKRNYLDKIEFLDAFRFVECLNFRVYMTRNGSKRSDSGQSWAFEIAHQFYKNFENNKWLKLKSNEDEVVYQSHVGALIGSLYDLVDDYIPNDRFKEGFILTRTDKDDFYKWGGIKYFLMNYERYINRKRTIKIEDILKGREGQKSNDFLSIEHIWARSNDVGGYRKNNIDDMFHKRRLGNYMLLELGLNSQAGQEDIAEKIKIYHGKNSDGYKSSLMQVNALIDDFTTEQAEINKRRSNRTHQYFADLYQKTIDRFEDRLVKFALERWSVQWAEKYWSDLEEKD